VFFPMSHRRQQRGSARYVIFIVIPSIHPLRGPERPFMLSSRRREPSVRAEGSIRLAELAQGKSVEKSGVWAHVFASDSHPDRALQEDA
jgi:hypothetical protein